MTVERVAIIDMGSNSFRLVVFQYEPGSWWSLADEIREATRVSAGMGEEAVLQPEPMDRWPASGARSATSPRRPRNASSCRTLGGPEQLALPLTELVQIERVERVERHTGFSAHP